MQLPVVEEVLPEGEAELAVVLLLPVVEEAQPVGEAEGPAEGVVGPLSALQVETLSEEEGGRRVLIDPARTH